jgi:hypothetical protein
MPMKDLELQLASAEKELAATRKSNERRVFWLAAGCGIAVLCGAVGVVIGIQGNLALGEFEDQRTQARSVSCQAENATAGRINGLNQRLQDTLRAIAEFVGPDPEVDAFIADQVAAFEVLEVPERDCTPAGIAEYFEDNATTVPQGD